jgi:dimeric dUTPase (all-alpha-NTP-PPase superfamily)
MARKKKQKPLNTTSLFWMVNKTDGSPAFFEEFTDALGFAKNIGLNSDAVDVIVIHAKNECPWAKEVEI